MVYHSEKLQQMQHLLQQGKDLLSEELWNSSKALVISLAQKATGKNILILTGGSKEETTLFHDFAVFTERPVVDFPAWETLPSENIPPSPDIVGERYKVLESLIDSKEPRIILSSLQASLQKVISPEHFVLLHLTLKTGDKISFDELVEKLKKMGYQRSAVASDKGEFAIRGGIVDIFPVSSPDPFRLEFWGDELESIRIYDPIGQKSIRMVNEIDITPGQELEILDHEAQLSTILDYLGSNTLVVFDDLLALEDRYANLLNLVDKQSKTFANMESFLDQLKDFQKIYFTQSSVDEMSQIKLLEKPTDANTAFWLIAFEMFNRELKAHRWFHPFRPLAEHLRPEDPESLVGDEIILALGDLEEKKSQIIFYCATELEESTLQKKILDIKPTLPQNVVYKLGYLSSGIVLTDVNVLIVPFTELTRRYKIRRQKLRSTYHTVPSEVYEFSPGDIVVHMNNGIGKYLGLEKKPNNQGILSEFFVIEYAENAKLFVPMSQAHLVSKYIGSGETAPKMHTLGSSRWKRTRDNTQKAIVGFANDMLKLYAQRELHGGFIYPEDSEDMMLFEEDFPFVETEDQLNAIALIKEDMRSKKAMDRLVCGDVGYGKTEVAMRAAFKCVVDGGKQVAVLVPTTVLAMQHYENFQERMRHFPVKVGVLSRFQTAKQIRETLEGVAQGSVDILVGTHRIISNDVQFKDLGMIIIDEEQRFGVKAKEHLKKIKVGVDCLTLSATPIPRTLYLSLIGARDMSVINTPPQDRLPIKTIITEPNDEVIKNAILRELSRDGQVYVIHNRVETIFEMATRIKKLVPQAKVAVGHGQMSSDDIDDVFHAFKRGQANVLVATTIVENGIDIPNANTILIDRADIFGLADLYQLRGRVGRWNRRAYAYFLVPRLTSLPEISRQRLNALAMTTGYGGGMKVAMRDLEIRGAGDILGIEQSGHVAAIGFHLYCKLLQKTIKALQGNQVPMLSDVKIDTTLDARIPETYVNEFSLRLELYQKLGEAAQWIEVDLILEEMKDRFGEPPIEVLWLYHLTRLKIYAGTNGISTIKIDAKSLTFEKQVDGETVTKKVFLPVLKNPEDWESKILEFLQK